MPSQSATCANAWHAKPEEPLNALLSASKAGIRFTAVNFAPAAALRATESQDFGRNRPDSVAGRAIPTRVEPDATV